MTSTSGVRGTPLDPRDDPALVAGPLGVQHLPGEESRGRGDTPEPRGERASDAVADGDRGDMGPVAVVVVRRRLVRR